MTDHRPAKQAASTVSEWTWRGEGGTELFARRWRPHAGPTLARLVVVHGYQEHGGRYRELACRLVGSGIETVAADLRGHGRSHGPRGHVERFSAYERDLAGLVASERPGEVPTFVLGHSLGGLITLRTAAAGQLPGVAGILVTNPYLDLAMPVPRLKVWLGLALARIAPNFALGNGIDPAWLTRDPEILAGYRRDPMLLNRATAGWFVATRAAQAEIRQRPSLPLPLWFGYSDADPIASVAANAAFAEQVVCPDKTVVLRPGELHELLQERDRLALIDAIAAWILARAPGGA